ncbi:MAG TPA: hypothetical protein VFG30_08940, partial [Polyangiales bacterium]|nr:hypothetical protein [Polyangiales bacterium]
MALAVLVGGVIFTAGRARYEALATLALDAPAAQLAPPLAAKRLLAGALRYAEDPPLTDPTMPRIFRVDVRRNQQLQLVCEAERRALAEQLCQQASTDAVAQSSGLRILSHTSSRALVRRRAFDAAWPALLASAGWFLVRTSRRPSRKSPAKKEQPSTPAANAVREYGSWSVPNRPVPASPIPTAGPSARRNVARRTVPIAQTMVGMPAVSARVSDPSEFEPTPTGHVNVLPSPPPPQPQLAPPSLSTRPSRVSSHPSSPDLQRPNVRESLGPDPATRVIYHVSTGPWSADRSVVTDEAMDDLNALRDEIYRQTQPGCRVVRVTSHSNSRYAKTQVAAQLGWVLADHKDKRVLLLEGDLDAPALHKVMRLNVPRGFGFSEQLQRFASQASPVSPNDLTLLHVSHGLDALVESKFGAPALFDSPEFLAVLSQQRNG